MKALLTVLVALLALVMVDNALGQRFPGRDRGESPRDSQRRDRESPRSAPAGALEPFAALERELPSLKVDVQIKREQIDAWSVVERDIRALAEMERARKRHLLALQDPGDRPPSALGFLRALVDGDRQKADLSADLLRHFDALYGSLDAAQRGTLDRRVILSQTEPLGR